MIVAARLLLIVAAAIVPAALLGALLVGFDYYDRERQRMIRDSAATTRALVAAVDMELNGVKSALLALATSPHLGSGDLAAFHSQAVMAVTSLKGHSLANVVVLDEAGRQMINTLRPFGAPLPQSGNPQELGRIFRTGETMVTDLFMGPVMQKPVLAIGVPVRRDGRIVYSLNAGVQTEALSALLGEQKLPPGWIARVYDRAGTIVARSRDAERFVGRQGTPELVQRMKEVPEDAIESRTLEGIDVLTVFSRSPESGWTVAIGIPRSELTTHLVSSMARLFVVVFIVLLTAIGLALLLARQGLR
jgi:hypothetical protein